MLSLSNREKNTVHRLHHHPRCNSMHQTVDHLRLNVYHTLVAGLAGLLQAPLDIVYGALATALVGHSQLTQG